MNRAGILLLAFFFVLGGAEIRGAPAHTQAALFLDTTEAKPGTTVWAGIRLSMDPGWHTYWRNSGDSGAPTEVKWTLPENIQAGQMHWPVPEKYVAQGFTTYVYHEEVLLMVPLNVGNDAKPGKHVLKADVTWLECADVCVPGRQTVQAELVVGETQTPSEDRSLFDTWKGRLPQADRSLVVHAEWAAPASADRRPFQIQWKSAPQPAADDVDFFPYKIGPDAEVLGDTEIVAGQSEALILQKEVLKYEGDWPKEVNGLLVAQNPSKGARAGYEVNLSLGSNPDKTVASLVLDSRQVRPGDTLTAAVRLRMPEGWHTYWRNPGESGGPTEVAWDLPEGFRAGDLQWPIPEKLDWQGIVTYGYHDEVMLLTRIHVGANVAEGEYELRGDVSWLECSDVCIPGGGSVEAGFRVGSEQKPSLQATQVDTWRKRLPQALASAKAAAHWDGPPEEGKRPLIIEWETDAKPAGTDFFPYPLEGAAVLGSTERFPEQNGIVRLRKTLKATGEAWPVAVHGLLVRGLEGEGPPSAGYEVELRPDQGESLETASSGEGAGTGQGGRKGSAFGWELISTLLGAFLGGLILNIMPCVLPVISLKILGFVNQAQEEPRRVKVMGFLFGVGVLVSFWILAGMVIGVQLAGGVASWGMQMQNPIFRVIITVVVLLVALNLFGLFEIHLSGQTMGAASRLAAKEGNAGAFFNGVLAVALATPCTAPILAAALGWAFLQPAWVIVLTFSFVAAGLAFPYVLLSWQPQWLRFLPKPGPWMLKFKVAMGFPMLATTIWLFDFTAPFFGEGSIFWLGMFLIFISLAAWVWGEFVQRGSRHPGVARAVSLLLVLVGYFYVMEKELDWRNQTANTAPPGVVQTEGGIIWKPWSREAVEQARKEGHPVLVDFTAKWCLTCKLNKRTSLTAGSVEEKIKELGVVTLRADNTDPTPRIAEELREHGRAGVPLNLVYPSDSSRDAIVLPTVLTPEIVLDALEKAASPAGKPGDQRAT